MKAEMTFDLVMTEDMPSLRAVIVWLTALAGFHFSMIQRNRGSGNKAEPYVEKWCDGS